MRLCLAVFVLVAGVSNAAAAATPPVLAVPQRVGDGMRYQISRTQQTADGPKTTTSDVTIQRKSPTTVALVRADAGHSADVIVLSIAADGSLQVPAADRTDAADPLVGDVVHVLNSATAVISGSTSAPAGWTAMVSVTGEGRSTSSVVIPMLAVNSSGDDFDIHGVGQAAATPTQPSDEGRGYPRRGGVSGGVGFPAGGGGFPGGGGGGFPGGSRGPRGGESDDGRPASAGTPGRAMTLSLHVDGHVHRGALVHLSIVETRSLTVGTMPFVNVSSWTIDARS